MIKQLALNEMSKIIKYGEYTLKNGEKSNVYVDVKRIISFPMLFSYITQLFSIEIKKYTKMDISLCGVPYGGINLSTAIAIKMDLPQILIRKDKKEYGMKNQIEGITYYNQSIILIEDVITTGGSVLEICEILKKHNINVVCIFCVVLRSEEGRNRIEESGYKLEHLFLLDEITLYSNKVLNINPLITSLRNSIWNKRTRIVLAYDKDKKDLFSLLNKISGNIIGLKIHSEILGLTIEEDNKLVKYCKDNNIFLWEDRKFNDIGETFRKQIKYYENRRDYISVVPISGYHMLEVDTKLGFFVLCEMSSDMNLFNNSLTSSILSYINNNVVGIICQNEDLFSLPLISIKPGLSFKKSGDNLGQKYTHPDDINNFPDLIVIGRDITESNTPEMDILIYKNV